MIYPNSDIQKLDALKDNKEKSGIYLWKNRINGKLYVGSGEDLARRLREYYNINYLNKDSGMLICKALLKYGYSTFSLYILEYCDEKDLLQREQYYIDILKPEYNILKIAGSSKGYKHTKEARAKISAALKGLKIGELNPMFGKKHLEKILAKLRGKKRTEETRAKMSISKTGYKYTEEARAKISSAKVKKIEVLNINTGERTEYSSGQEASNSVGCSTATIVKCIKNDKPFKGIYKFRKIDT
uniref:GIY-YIG domain-containing protein n=1 Tax=Orbilia brochopaga TaxID=3140254 RepID=A0A4Y5N025_9PEZI|nr:hypothetical protein [Drechslerella brochopaga]